MGRLRNVASLVKKTFVTMRDEGFDAVIYKAKCKTDDTPEYTRWMARNEKEHSILKSEALVSKPFFSVVIPCYNVDDGMLRECLNSVLNQTYRYFEMVLVDDASTMPSVKATLKEYEEKYGKAGNDRVKVIYREVNGNISLATNDGIMEAKGEFIALCDCDDLYAPNALYEVAKLLDKKPDLDMIYTDEDKIDELGLERRDPFFKPDWSPETFMSYMYPCHLSVYRKSLLLEVGMERKGFEGAQDYDLLLRVMEKTDRIGHVPKILYHWRMRKESTSSDMQAKPYVLEATRKAKEEALERRGLKGHLELIEDISQYRVVYEPQGNPLCSVIIPSKDNPKVLEQCLRSIVNMTDYANYEIVVVDNGSDDENKAKVEKLVEELDAPERKVSYVYEKREFNFSYMCNLGARNAKGDYYLFLNDDIEITDKVKQNPRIKDVRGWMTRLLGQAQVSYTGAVGAKLYYPGGIIFQHAGVVNYGIGPGHCFYGMPDDTNYYYGRNILDYNFSVVTGACLLVSRLKFEEAGGFDEELAVAYNDVALCFSLIEKGYYNVLRNDVALVHHESVSRGLDAENEAKEIRRKREMAKLYDKHPGFAMGVDPCYNPNLSGDRNAFNLDDKKLVEPSSVGTYESRGKELVWDKNSVKVKVDSICYGDDAIRIAGYGYFKNKRNNNKNGYAVVLMPDNKDEDYENYTDKHTAYFAAANRVYVKGFADERGRTRGFALCHFDSIISRDDIEPGEYKLMITIGGGLVDTGEHLRI
ncbi:MAG: glycosyltransferase [Lachnospiraceae bacterium]|nr:glycosyltransferase [Lachnospiraceae bacterium]